MLRVRSTRTTILPDNETAVSHNTTTELAAPIFGEHAQDLIDCNQKLKELGIDKTIKLPQIVVIGDQSTGKSSLIEAISTIKVPKAAGLCTKCPIAINLSSGSAPDAPWTCAVYIEEIFTYNASISKHKKITKSNPLGPWQVSKDTVSKKLRVSTNREEVCKLISYAQDQLLNPLRKHQTNFDPSCTYDQSSEEKFSPNVIRLDISQGGWPNLSFVDLPGVIQNAGVDEPEYYVHVVKALAEKYAMDDNNVIMLTLPMNHDVSNSGSYNIAVTKAPERTIAVFTKVDMVRDQERANILEQYFDRTKQKNRFTLGNHIVMLADSGLMTADESRAAEDDFFSKTQWMDLPHLQGQLGINKLQDRLRHVLFQMTADTLPHNLEAIRQRMHEVRYTLANMPDPPDTIELPYQLREVLHTYATQLEQVFSTGTSKSKLHEVMEEFQGRIIADEPTLVPNSQAERSQMTEADRKIREGSQYEPMTVDSDADTSSQTKRLTNRKSMGGHVGACTIPEKRAHRFQLEEIRAINKTHNTSNTPGGIEPKALEQLNKLSVKNFHKTLDDLNNSVEALVHHEIITSISVAFANNRHLALYDELIRITNEYLEKVLFDNKVALDIICDVERRCPFTLDAVRMKDLAEKILVNLQNHRLKVRIALAKSLQAAADIGKAKKRATTINEADVKFASDEWETEVAMSAKSRAYYQIASSRFIDNVCQHILMHLVPRCHDLVKYIKTELGLDDIPANRKKIAALMSEDQEREQERERLRIEERKLQNGHEQIEQVLCKFRAAENDENAIDVDEATPDEDISPSLPTSSSTPTVSPTKRKATYQASFDDDEWSAVETSPMKKTKIANGMVLRTPGGRNLAHHLRDTSLE